MNRKDFLKTSAAAGIGLTIVPQISLARSKNNDVVRLGFIGVGSRGTGHLRGMLARTDIIVPAICDINETNAKTAAKMVLDAGKGNPELYTSGPDDYKKLVDRDDLDGILISTPWEYHV